MFPSCYNAAFFSFELNKIRLMKKIKYDDYDETDELSFNDESYHEH